MKEFRMSLFTFAFMLLMFPFSSCENEPELVPDIILAKVEMNFTATSGNSVLAIKSNMPWTATSSQTWCTLNPASGEAGTKQIAVTVTENSTGATREAAITITAGSLSKEVKVIQETVNFSIGTKEYNIESAGGDIVVNIQSSSAFTSTIQQEWITLKSTSADKKTITYTVAENSSIIPRKGTIAFVSGNISDTVKVQQSARSLNISADATGMGSNAKTLAAKMYMGWNLGNTLECPGSETAWGNPLTTQALIDSVKAAGFNTIRIPCAWDSHMEDATTFKIKSSWLTRVKEVVDYCYSNNMYIILNIHWDGGWLEENPTYAKQAAVNVKQKAFWEQIGVYFRDYDEHLLFAGTNEVHDGYGAPTTENITVQLSYNQTFVDAVRSTGGKNAYRNLVIQAYNTNIDQAVSFLKIANDTQQNRLFVEVHYYDPWDFCGESGTNAVYYWGEAFKQYGKVSSWGQESYVPVQFNKMKTNFVDKGFPVILGEYSATRRSSLVGDALIHHLESRAYYFEYVTEQAKIYGLVPCYWDNGGIGNDASGLFNRNTKSVFDRQALNALMRGAAKGKYPF